MSGYEAISTDASDTGPLAATPGPPSRLHGVMRDMPSYALANGSLAVAGFLGLSLFTRWLSAAEYGLYALTMTAATVTESVLFSWVNNATLRYLPAHDRHESTRVFLTTSFVVSSALLLIVSALWVATALFFGQRAPSAASTVRAGVAVLASRVLFGFVVGVVRARRQTARYALYTAASASGAVLLAAGVRATVGDIGPEGLLYMASVAAGIPVAVELFRSKSLSWLRPRLFRAGLARRCASYGLPLAGAAFGAAVLSVADRYLLQWFGTTSDVGAYSAGYDLTDKSLKLVIAVLVASALPVVMTVLSRHGPEEASTLVGRTLRIYLVWMVPFTVTVIAFRAALVQAVLGPDFGRAVVVVPWVAVGTLCWGASQILAQVFQVHERTAPLFHWLLAAAAVSVGLNLWLIPATGLTGAALATAATYAFYLAALWFARVRTPALAVTAGDGGVVATAGAVMFAVMTFLPTGLEPWFLGPLAKLILGLAAYGISIRWLRPPLFEEVGRDLRAILALARRWTVKPSPGEDLSMGRPR